MNAEAILTAIEHFFGGGNLGFAVSDLINPDLILQMGVAPQRIDLLSSLPGVESFAQAWSRREAGRYGSRHTTWPWMTSSDPRRRPGGIRTRQI